MAIVIVRMRMTEQTAPLFLILRGMPSNFVLTAPSGRNERLVGGLIDVDVPVLLLVDPEELLAAGHGVTSRFTGRLVGRKDGEGRLLRGRRQNNAAGVARLGRPIGAGDTTAGGEGGGHDQIELVGMTGRGDSKAAKKDVLLVDLGLSGGAGDVGVPVDPERLAVVVATLAVALGPAIASRRKTAAIVVVGGISGNGGGYEMKDEEEGGGRFQIVYAEGSHRGNGEESER